jgi:hypothetical protein
MGEDGQGFSVAMFFLHAGEILLARGIGAQQQHRRFREGPFERGIAPLRAGGAIALSRRCLRTLDEAAVGHNILAPGEALEVMDFLQ